MSPLAGSATACVMFDTKSALGILQLSAQRRDGRASFVSPAGDFASAHAAGAPISSDLSDGSFENCPTCESANHGAMDVSCVVRRIAPANSRISPYVSNDIGAMPPSWWKLWQCCSRIGRHGDKRSVVSLWERPARAIRSASTEAMTARHQQGMHEVLGGCESACDYHAPPSPVARFCQPTVSWLASLEWGEGMPEDRFSGILVTWRGKRDGNYI